VMREGVVREDGDVASIFATNTASPVTPPAPISLAARRSG